MGETTSVGVGATGLYMVEAGAHPDTTQITEVPVVAKVVAQVRGLGEGGVELHGGAHVLEGADAGAEVGGKVSLVDNVQQGALGVEVGDYRSGPDLTTVGKLYADGRAVFNEDTSDLGAGLELSAVGAGGSFDGTGKAAHATLEDALVSGVAEVGGLQASEEERRRR